MWLDGIYMLDVFYARWTASFESGNSTAWDDIALQVHPPRDQVLATETCYCFNFLQVRSHRRRHNHRSQPHQWSPRPVCILLPTLFLPSSQPLTLSSSQQRLRCLQEIYLGRPNHRSLSPRLGSRSRMVHHGASRHIRLLPFYAPWSRPIVEIPPISH